MEYITTNIRNFIMSLVANTYNSKLYIVLKCIRKGYLRRDIDFVLSDIVVNRKAFRTSTCKKRLLFSKGGTLLKKYNKEIDGLTVIEDINVEKESFSPKQHLNKKILLLFTCSSGALLGNYFYTKIWKTLSIYFPERYTKDIDFAAIDSLTLKLGNMNSGAIVFENEMERVKGLDMNPSCHNYTKEEMEKLVTLIIKGLIYSFDVLKFQHIICYLNVKNYSDAFERALENIPPTMKNKITFYRCGCGHGPFLKGLPKLRKKYKEIRFRLKNNYLIEFERIILNEGIRIYKRKI